MTNILLRGPFATNSGYGSHARQVARWLLERNSTDRLYFELLPWGNTPWELSDELHSGLIGKVLSNVRPIDRQIDVSFQVQLPNEWDPKKAKYNIGVTAAMETDRCNPTWIAACNSMNDVVVPSNHSKNSLTNTGRITVPIHVIPEAFPDACLSEQKQTFDFETTFNFLVFGQLTGNNPENDRKNIFYTIKWLCEEFGNNEDVGIVIKTNAGRNSKQDKHLVVDLFTKLLSEVRKSQFPKIHLLHGNMLDEEVVSIYTNKNIKSLVTLTRGEGFGLPILEAATCGVPIIAPAWSGYMDFMNHGKFIKVNHVVKQIHPSRIDNQLFMEGAKWCEPDERDFKRRVRKFYESPNEPKNWAIELSNKLKTTHCFSNIASIFESTFGDVLK